MPGRETGVTVAAGEAAGGCLVMVKVDGEIALTANVHWSLAPMELVELLREFTARHADACRAAQAAERPAPRPLPAQPGRPALRLA